MTAAIIESIQSELSAALPRWGMSSQATLAFLSHSENTTFLAEDPRAGQRLVLRVQRIDYHSPAEIVSELAWIAALITDEVIVTPRPLPDRDGRLLCSVPLNGSMRQVVAFEHMSGHEPDATATLPTWFLKLGALTARLLLGRVHLVLRRLPFERPALFLRTRHGIRHYTQRRGGHLPARGSTRLRVHRVSRRR